MNCHMASTGSPLTLTSQQGGGGGGGGSCSIFFK